MTIENSLANPVFWPNDAVVGLEVTVYAWPFRNLGSYFEFFRTPEEFAEWTEQKRGIKNKIKYVVTEWRWDWGPQLVDTSPRTI